MENYLTVTDLKKTYLPKGQAPVEALRGVSLDVKMGEMIAITGVSGSGKSTLLHILGFLDKPSSGTHFFGKSIDAKLSDRALARLRNREVGFVLQDFALIPYRSAFENIEIPLIFAGTRRKSRIEKIEKVMNELGILELRNRKVSQMSGGQKQRVAIARALVNDPKLILADEPTGALDTKTKKEILKIFQMIHKSGKTMIIVTHDPDVAAIADRRMHIEDGKLTEIAG